MRKLLSTLSVLLFFVIVTRAQAPAFINYQGVARNAVGNAMVNHTIRLKLTIRDGGALGPSVYSETRQLITNTFGLFNVQIGGAGATNVTGSIGGANWNNGTKWLQVEIDPEGGTTFKDIGTTQLISVPYSLYTNQSGDIVLPFSKSQGEDVPLFKLVNTNNNAGSLAYEGSSSSTANNATAIRGILTSVNPGVFSAAVTGQNNGTGANGIGVYGNQNGSGWGVYGTTPGGIGVYGNSTSGTGVYGQSFSGASVYGFKDLNGTGNVGLFRNTSIVNPSAVVGIQSNGPGDGMNIAMTGMGAGAVININNTSNNNTLLTLSGNGLGKTTMIQNSNTSNSNNVLEVSSNGTGKVGVLQNTNTSNASNVLDVSTNGTGRAGYFQNTGAANNSNVVEVTTNGTGKAGVFQNTNAANASNVLDATTNGTGRTGLFQNTNAANASSNVSLLTNGVGDNLQSVMTGTGKASSFTINNSANASFAIDATSNGTNNVINSINTGTGRAGFFQVNNAASTADALSAVTNGVGASWAIRGTSSGTNGAGLFVQNNATNTANNLQSNQAGLGRAGFFNATNAANTANALEVNTAGTGFAANFISTNATPKALHTSGAIQLTGIGEGANKILMTDLSGNANWNSLASVGGVSGTGTLDYVAKWTPNGTFVGNSQIFDNGTNVGINTNIPTSKLFVNGDFIARTNATGYVGTFENTNATDGDGIKIKLGRIHPAWNGSAYKQIDAAALISPFQPQIDIVKNWIETGHSVTASDIIGFVQSNVALLAGSLCQLTNFLTDQLNTRLGLPFNLAGPLNTALGLPVDLSAPINSGLGLPYDLTAPINSNLGLPISISLLSMINGLPGCDWLVDDDDLPGPTWQIVPALPSIKIPAIPNTFSIPAIPSFSIPAIPQINCSGLPALNFPNIDFNGVTNSLTKNNNFLTFADMGDRQVGAIRSQSIPEWRTSYLSPTFFLGLAGSMAGLDLSGAVGKVAGAVVTMVGAYNKIGIEYVSGNGDYAEWLPRLNSGENISEGDIVGVKGGMISKDITGAEQIMAVSHKPIVLGNIPEKGKETMGNNIAFMGQIPVKIMGPVRAGDYIIAKGDFPGMGVAIHPEAMTVADYKLIVGRSWDTDEKNGPKMVNTVVGLHNNDFLKFVSDLQQKAQTTEERLRTIEEKLNIAPATTSTPAAHPTKKAFKK